MSHLDQSHQHTSAAGFDTPGQTDSAARVQLKRQLAQMSYREQAAEIRPQPPLSVVPTVQMSRAAGSTSVRMPVQAVITVAESDSDDAGGGGEPRLISELPGEPLEFIDDQDDTVAATLNYEGNVTHEGDPPPENLAGYCRSWLNNWTNVVISPPADGSIAVSADLTYTIQWQVHETGPGGRVDVPDENAACLHQGNYAQAASDLTPDMSALNGRPPRTQFWARDLTMIHEQFHAEDRRRLGEEGAAIATNWLNAQTVESQDEVEDLLITARTDSLHAHVASNMTMPGREERAYGDGAPLYLERATAIKDKGDAGNYPEAPE